VIHPNSIWIELNGIVKKNFWGDLSCVVAENYFQNYVESHMGLDLSVGFLKRGVGLQVMCSNSRIIFAHDFNTI